MAPSLKLLSSRRTNAPCSIMITGNATTLYLSVSEHNRGLAKAIRTKVTAENATHPRGMSTG